MVTPNTNQPTKTWTNPRWANTPEWARPIIQSLEQFLARPTFYNGVKVGDGTGPTKDAEGVTSQPTLADWNLTSKQVIENALAQVGTDLDGVYADLTQMQADITALETNPIDGTRITDNSIATPKLQANSITADKLAAINIGVGKWIASTSYQQGSSGWIIAADGTAEFNNITVRGPVTSPDFKTAPSGARVRMGTANTSADEIQFISAAGGIGSIRNPQINSYGSSLRLSAGGLIDIYGTISFGSIDMTAPGGGQINMNASGGVYANGWVVVHSGNVSSYAAPQGHTHYGETLQLAGVTSPYGTLNFNGGVMTLSSAGSLSVGGSLLTAHPTTTTVANCVIGTNGLISRFSSSQRWKANIADWAHGGSLFSLQARQFTSRLHDGDLGGTDDPELLRVGLVAEEAAAAHPKFATYEDDGVTPLSIDWNAITVALIEEVKRLRSEVDSLLAAP